MTNSTLILYPILNLWVVWFMPPSQGPISPLQFILVVNCLHFAHVLLCGFLAIFAASKVLHKWVSLSVHFQVLFTRLQLHRSQLGWWFTDRHVTTGFFIFMGVLSLLGNPKSSQLFPGPLLKPSIMPLDKLKLFDFRASLLTLASSFLI